MSLLVICEFLGHFLNTLTADDKYSLRNSANLSQPIQVELYKQQKFFSFFATFTKFILSFKDVEKKDDPHSLCISKMADCEIRD